MKKVVLVNKKKPDDFREVKLARVPVVGDIIQYTSRNEQGSGTPFEAKVVEVILFDGGKVQAWAEISEV